MDGAPVILTPTQQTLVEALLVQHPDRWTARSALVEAVWPNPDTQPEGAYDYITVLVRHLRGKGVPIESRSGWGYRIPAGNRPARPLTIGRRILPGSAAPRLVIF